MTREAWETLPPAYKGYVDGKPYALYLDPETQGTVYGPVEITGGPREAIEVDDLTDERQVD